MPLCAESAFAHGDVRLDRWRGGCCRLVAERKPLGKVGSRSSVAIKVVGNLQGRAEEQYKGMQLEPLPPGEICRVFCVCVVRVRWKAIPPSVKTGQ